jgi:hypothetical protein
LGCLEYHKKRPACDGFRRTQTRYSNFICHVNIQGEENLRDVETKSSSMEHGNKLDVRHLCASLHQAFEWRGLSSNSSDVIECFKVTCSIEY